jgi:hypothetical protein
MVGIGRWLRASYLDLLLRSLERLRLRRLSRSRLRSRSREESRRDERLDEDSFAADAPVLDGVVALVSSNCPGAPGGAAAPLSPGPAEAPVIQDGSVASRPRPRPALSPPELLLPYILIKEYDEWLTISKMLLFVYYLMYIPDQSESLLYHLH